MRTKFERSDANKTIKIATLLHGVWIFWILIFFSTICVFENFSASPEGLNLWIQAYFIAGITENHLQYRNEFYFCGFYRCVNSGEPLTNWVKPQGLYVKFVSDSPEFVMSRLICHTFPSACILHLNMLIFWMFSNCPISFKTILQNQRAILAKTLRQSLSPTSQINTCRIKLFEKQVSNRIGTSLCGNVYPTHTEWPLRSCQLWLRCFYLCFNIYVCPGCLSQMF